VWVDLVIAFALLEGLALALYFRATGRGVPPAQFGVSLASGLCLMFALRCALDGAASLWVALWLLAAGLAHAADLWRQWQKKISPPA
jgi:hypothetical protein